MRYTTNTKFTQDGSSESKQDLSRSLLEVILLRVRGDTIKFCTIQEQERQNTEQLLIEEIQKLESENNAKSLIGNLDIPKLGENDKKKFEGKLTIKEIGAALKSMKKEKNCPEFYKVFWAKLKVIVLNSLNESYDS